MSGALCALACGALPGCITTTPLQTASVVDAHKWRLGGQLAATPYCSVSFDPLGRCALVPTGIPLPEVRASARYGVADATDLGLSISGSAVIPTGVSAGAVVDGKRELWSREITPGHRELVAASAGVGGRFDFAGAFGGIVTPHVEPELSVPVSLWYGRPIRNWEGWVSPRFVERVAFFNREALTSSWVGASVGAVSDGPIRVAVGFDYLAPVGDLTSGPVTVGIGVLYDVP